MLDKIKALWIYVQDLLDVQGGTLMSLMTGVFIFRVFMSVFSKYPSITVAESAMYASAIASLAATNIGGPKS